MLNLLNNIKFYQKKIDPDIMIILTSATLDEDQLAKTFNVDITKQFIRLEAIQTDNKLDYPTAIPENITEHIIAKIREHQQKNILIFVPYLKPIGLLTQKLKAMFVDNDVFPLSTKNFER
jgi:HrpA-like RNA helicase